MDSSVFWGTQNSSRHGNGNRVATVVGRPLYFDWLVCTQLIILVSLIPLAYDTSTVTVPKEYNCVNVSLLGKVYRILNTYK